MYNISNEITKIKYMYFCDLYQLITNNTFEYLMKSNNIDNNIILNIEIGTEYKIFQTANKKIFCINKQSGFIDINKINQHYLKYMRISIKSFNNSLDDDKIYSHADNNSYQINLIINKIINYVFNVNNQTEKKIKISNILLPSNVYSHTDFDKIFKLNKFKIEISTDFNTKLKIITNFFNYIYNNINDPNIDFKFNQQLIEFIFKIIKFIYTFDKKDYNIDSNNLVITFDAITRLLESML